MISGATQVCGLVGGPDQVLASRSPAIYRAAFEALSMDWVYVGFPVGASPQAAITGLFLSGVRGLNVTMPHKLAALACADRLTPAAQAIGSVNTLAATAKGVVGDNTDAAGFEAAAARSGIGLAGRRVAVIGAGGAARACLHALDKVRASEIVVAARDAEAAARLAPLCGPTPFSVVELSGLERSSPDVIVNATPVGQRGERLPFDLDWTADVIDLTYHVDRTPLMDQAEANGGTAVNGLGMLVLQAAASFEVITDRAAPVETMFTAAEGSDSVLKQQTGGAD